MDGIKGFLPLPVQRALEEQPGLKKDLMEIRMGVKQPVFLRTVDGEEALTECRPSIRELSYMLERMMQYSLYAYREQMGKGYVTLKGGHRLGVSGAVKQTEEGVVFQHITYMNLRIAHEVSGCAQVLWESIPHPFQNTVLVSPPGHGKTTMLRDLVRILSREGYYVSLVDERQEVAACYEGVPQFGLGERTNVLSGCEKSTGMELLVRSMAPDVIAVDEIGCKEDFEAIRYAENCGCRLLCTMHATTASQVRKKGMDENFNIVFLERKNGKFSFRVEGQ